MEVNVKKYLWMSVWAFNLSDICNKVSYISELLLHLWLFMIFIIFLIWRYCRLLFCIFLLYPYFFLTKTHTYTFQINLISTVLGFFWKNKLSLITKLELFQYGIDTIILVLIHQHSSRITLFKPLCN